LQVIVDFAETCKHDLRKNPWDIQTVDESLASSLLVASSSMASYRRD
jgi:hypothetical protein